MYKRLIGLVIGTVTGGVAAAVPLARIASIGSEFSYSGINSYIIIVGAVLGYLSARYIKTSSGWFHYFLIPVFLGTLVPGPLSLLYLSF